jgi:hypothetical protein
MQWLEEGGVFVKFLMQWLEEGSICEVLNAMLGREIGRGVEFLDVYSFFSLYISMPYSEQMIWTSFYPVGLEGMWSNRL